MCIDTDLFGDVVVTQNDVEIWLRCVPRYDNGMRKAQVSQYINDYDVINKIKRAKLDNSFYCLNDKSRSNLENLSHTLASLLKPRFVHSPHITHGQHQKRIAA